MSRDGMSKDSRYARNTENGCNSPGCCLICLDIPSQLVVPVHVFLKMASLYQCLLRLELMCGTSSQDLILMDQTGVFSWEHTGNIYA